uniref:DUF4283 domain-containing protein n=1 Tax=Manihot esculenta TaxID=3983 RepID=A0A2C9W061_MANES
MAIATPAFTLVDQLLTDRSINFGALHNTLSVVWRPGRGVNIKKIGDRLYLFRFFHAVDVNWVLEARLYSFNNHLLLLHHVQPEENPSTVPLYFSPFWVQIHGDFIGSYLLYDSVKNSGGWQTFMRVRVMIDVRKPLHRSKQVLINTNERFTMNFKYERLPIFCFICDKLGHSEGFCEKLFDDTNLPHMRG